jgi:hypothetical protein
MALFSVHVFNSPLVQTGMGGRILSVVCSCPLDTIIAQDSDSVQSIMSCDGGQAKPDTSKGEGDCVAHLAIGSACGLCVGRLIAPSLCKKWMSWWSCERIVINDDMK